MFIGVEVVGVRIEMPSNQPIVLLKEIGGSRFLPIWVGVGEASAIAFAQQGVQPPRPLTHDLMRDLMVALDVTLETVQLTKVKDGVFFANLLLRDTNDKVKEISARPSDAIAIALRTDTQIFASRQLLDEAGIELPEPPEGESIEIERFKQFLDEVNPEDFVG